MHKLKTRDFVPTQRRAAQLWRRAKEIKVRVRPKPKPKPNPKPNPNPNPNPSQVHSECKEQPPCDPGGICAHQPGQRVCSLYATLVRDPYGLNATLDTLEECSRSSAAEGGAPLVGQSAGYCAVTEFGADCASDESGAWKAASLDKCVALCRCCARCSYVSFTAAGGECSWYAACEIAGLTRQGDWTTVKVK